MKGIRIFSGSHLEVEKKINEFFEKDSSYRVLDILLLYSSSTEAIIAVFFYQSSLAGGSNDTRR